MANIPTNPDGVEELTGQVIHMMYDLLNQNGVPSWIAWPLAAITGGIVAIGSVLRLALNFVLKEVAVPIAIAIIQLISDVRKEGAREFAGVAAEAMGEFMGMDVSIEALVSGVGPAANLQRARTIGGAFHEMLTAEFTPDGTVTPETGQAAARAFSGYVINFSATNAFISIISELISLDHLEQFRELGVEIAQNLGLGRLHRSAMRPLIDATIVKPYTRYLARKYRPDTLTDAQYVTALAAGRMTLEQVKDALAQKGYPDDLISEVLFQHDAKLTEHEIGLLVAFGELTQQQGLDQLRQQGLNGFIAQGKLNAAKWAKVEQQEATYADELLELVKDRQIDSVTYTTLLDRLHMSDDERQVRRNRAGIWLDSHHKRLSLSEMRFLVQHSQLTSADFHNWAIAEGFSDDDALLLELDVALRDSDAAQKIKIAKYRYAKAVALAKKKGEAVPPPPIGVDPIA